MSSLGERLKKSREKLGLKQVEVSKRTNINNRTLSRYENGGSEPDVDTLKTLADLYGVSVDYLTGHENSSRKVKEQLIAEEKIKLAEAILNLPEDKKQIVIDMIKALSDKDK